MPSTIKDFLPPVLLPPLRWFGGVSFHGDYPSWEAAMAKRSGYEDGSIIKQVAEAAAKVRDGLSAYERDGVNFDAVEYSWPVATALMAMAASRRGRLKVLDFGGALGSSYYQNRKLLAFCESHLWAVVEQKAFVEIGRAEFQTESLRFHESVGEAAQDGPFDIALIGATLNYLEKPYETLDEIAKSGVELIVLDRTMTAPGRTDRLTIQKMPKSLQDASYPAWIFAEDSLLERLSGSFELLESFQAMGGVSWLRAPLARAEFKGYIFKRKRECRAQCTT